MNRLINESSPYLQQHAHNPVDWYPWCDAAFEEAKRQNKPVLVSIGYAACHWCHVMERESFEDIDIANYMNEHFINIKVDREEHPDVDHLYMDALQAMNGQGGWPLNMFVTPERKPFYGGTYFPPRRMYQRNSWMEILEALKTSWLENPNDIQLQANQLVQHLEQLSLMESKEANAITKSDITTIKDNVLRNADSVWGGFGSAPKFPSTMTIKLLLQNYFFTKDQAALQQALLSLDKMIEGGIYDQIGGGFSRYATDTEWLVPHFEKMLYDNALLMDVLCDAYSITKEDKYKSVIIETMTFCIEKLGVNGGENGFYSAIDADSEGVEGKYYVWTQETLMKILGADLHPALIAYWDITETGNWEGNIILHRSKSTKEILDNYNITASQFEHILSIAKTKLWAERERRIAPLTDTKIILSWNAMLNKAISKAGLTLDIEKYNTLAATHLEWMLTHFEDKNSGKLFHIIKSNGQHISANLEDYAFLMDTLLYNGIKFNDFSWINKSKTYLASLNKEFLDTKSGLYFFTSNIQQDIIVRKIETYDGAIPSSNAIIVQVKQQLGLLLEDVAVLDSARYALSKMQQMVIRYPTTFSQWALSIQQQYFGQYTLVNAGDAKNKDWLQFKRNYFPNIIFVEMNEFQGNNLPILEGKQQSKEELYYLCREFSCLAPVNNLKEIENKIIFE